MPDTGISVHKPLTTTCKEFKVAAYIMFSTFSVHRNKLQERNKRHTNLYSELFLVIVALKIICAYACVGSAYEPTPPALPHVLRCRLATIQTIILKSSENR